MKKTYFTVGPSQTLPSVAKYTRQALKEEVFSMSHRDADFTALYQHFSTGLRELLTIPADYHIFLVSSGTEAMERVIQNGVRKQSFHFIEGKFGDRFYQVAQELGKQPVMVEQDGFDGFEFNKVTIPEDTELIAFTQNDTSTGVQIPMKEIYTIHEKYPDVLIAIDTVSSMPYADIDYTQTDCVFFSIQKGFGLPAGLGVMIVSPRAVERARVLHNEGEIIGTYHNYLQLADFEKKFQTPETPNVFALYLLDKVISEFLNVGVANIRAQTMEKALYLYGFFQNHPSFKPLIDNEEVRSRTTLVIEVVGGSKELVKKLAAKGLIVGSGYGEYKDSHIRIANFPAHTMEDIRRLTKSIEEVVRDARTS